MIFVTGGAGYIGTHTCVELLNAGHTQQPAADCGPGGGGATRVFECVGQRLRDA